MTGNRTQLRREARAARRAFVQSLSPFVRRAIEASLAERLAPALAGAGVIGAHVPHGSEIGIEAALRALAQPVAWPRVSEQGWLSFHLCDRARLAPGTHGIPEPPPGLPEVMPDLLLVPLLLFDRHGNRLGQGGGHYDRTLARLRAMAPVRAVGVAFDMQEADGLEPKPWDEPLDAVATPSRFHCFAGRARAAP